MRYYTVPVPHGGPVQNTLFKSSEKLFWTLSKHLGTIFPSAQLSVSSSYKYVWVPREWLLKNVWTGASFRTDTKSLLKWQTVIRKNMWIKYLGLFHFSDQTLKMHFLTLTGNSVSLEVFTSLIRCHMCIKRLRHFSSWARVQLVRVKKKIIRKASCCWLSWLNVTWFCLHPSVWPFFLFHYEHFCVKQSFNTPLSQSTG